MTELNPIIHSQLRLSILSILMSMDEADFMYLKQKTEATMGNLSVQITKLEEAGYIMTEKTFQGKRPRTVCRMTETGKTAFHEYVAALSQYIRPALDNTTADSQPGLQPC
ncbi:transcriptional regulator [Barnesiella sp. WM24]|uniref:winged helix-turn-helix domain-containing protein n=1 Tax=Barnesiella sp. WM24 TaxID=2558278 RepID=UPI001072950E|nr:transcriptional regulator [Barnesiella sp. WM24]TFU95033.1 transcriptional regulator [Barnesiella sp. WM24]